VAGTVAAAHLQRRQPCCASRTCHTAAAAPEYRSSKHTSNLVAWHTQQLQQQQHTFQSTTQLPVGLNAPQSEGTCVGMHHEARCIDAASFQQRCGVSAVAEVVCRDVTAHPARVMRCSLERQLSLLHPCLDVLPHKCAAPSSGGCWPAAQDNLFDFFILMHLTCTAHPGCWCMPAMPNQLFVSRRLLHCRGTPPPKTSSCCTLHCPPVEEAL
jgi:hypothetical protein